MSSTDASPGDATTAPAGTRGLLRRGALVALAAVVANVAIYVAARVADVPLLVAPAGQDVQQVPAAAVVVASVVGTAVGVGLLLGLRRFAPGALRWFGVVVAVGTVASMAGLGAAEDTATAVVLGAMHVVVGAAVVAGLGTGTAVRR